MAITYDPTTNIILVVGYTEAIPCNFENLYDADKGGSLQLLSPKVVAPETEVRRPNALGDYQEWETLVDTSHFGALSDQDDATYIQTVGSSSKRDIQHLQDLTLGTIESIEIKVRAYAIGSGGKEKLYIMDRLGTTERLTSIGDIIRNSWNEYSTGTLTTDPDGNPWTVANFNNLQAGIQVQTLGDGETLRVSEVWIIVTAAAYQTSLDRQVRPADSGALRLSLIITNFSQSGTVTLTGKDAMGDAQTEDVSITGNGTFTTQKSFNSIDTNGISATGNYTLEITQPRWGVVWKMDYNSFRIDAKIRIGVFIPTFEIGHFGDEGKNVEFVSVPSPHIDLDYGTLRLGKLVDETLKIVELGVSVTTNVGSAIIIDAADQVFLYGSLFTATSRTYSSRLRLGEDSRVWACTLDNVYLQMPSGDATPDVYRLTQQMGTYGIELVTSSGTWDDIFSHSITYGIFMQAGFEATVKNYVLKNNTYVAYLQGFSGNLNLINPEVDTWAIYYFGASTGKLWRQYEFDLTVTDKDNTPLSGAVVTLKDKDDNEVFQLTTDGNGKITTQTVSRGWYEQTTGDTLNEYSPHTLTIEKAGYQTYEKKFTLEAKTDWEIKLAKAVGVFLSFGSPVVNLKKTDPENKNVMVL